jgi:hypothetical protein
VTQSPGSVSELRSNSLDNLNNTHRRSAIFNYNHLKLNSLSYDSDINSILLVIILLI